MTRDAVNLYFEDGSLVAEVQRADNVGGDPLVRIAASRTTPPRFAEHGYGVDARYGDGVADATAHIQNRIDAAWQRYEADGRQQVVRVPPGEYAVRYASTFNTTNWGAWRSCLMIRPGVHIIGDGLPTIKAPAVPGAHLDGAVTLPHSTITVDSTAGFPSSGTVKFDGARNVAYTGKTDTAFTGCTGGAGTYDDRHGIVLVPSSRTIFATDGDVEVSNWSIRGIRIDGQADQSTAHEVDQHAVLIGPSSDWSITDCEITRVLADAIGVQGETSAPNRAPSRFRISNCRIHDIAGNAIGWSARGANNFVIDGNWLYNPWVLNAEGLINGASSVHGTDGRIVNNTILWGSNGVSGTRMIFANNYVRPPAGSSTAAVGSVAGSDVSFVGNIIDMTDVDISAVSCTEAGIDGLVIQGNTIIRHPAGTGAGIRLGSKSGVHRASIVGNTIRGATTATAPDIDVRAGVPGCHVATNRMSGPATLYCTQSDMAFIGNFVDGGALLFFNAPRAFVSSNRITARTGGIAVRLSGDCPGAVVAGNIGFDWPAV